MLSCEGNENGENSNNNRCNQQKSNFARVAHFFLHFFAVVLHDYIMKLQKFLSYTFFGGNVVRVLVHFFSLTLIFTLHWRPLAFLMLSPPLKNFHVSCSFNKKMSPLLFFFYLQISVSLFIVGLRWPAAYFLFFSFFLLLYIPNLWA